MAETAMPSVTLYFQLSAYQQGESWPKGNATALTESYLFNRSSLSLAGGEHQTNLWHGPGDYKIPHIASLGRAGDKGRNTNTKVIRCLRELEEIIAVTVVK